MNELNPLYSRSTTDIIAKQNTLIRKVYAWMGIGLAITAFMALATLSSPAILNAILGNRLTSTFVITAGMFGAMSLYGSMTKRDLTSWGSFLFMGLIGIIIASVVNIFVGSSAISWVVSGIGVIVFTGLTAYDTWKIKEMAAQGIEGRKPAIILAH